MNKVLWLLGLMLVSAAAFASTSPTDLASFFQPAPDDLSAWYLANVFGSDLVPGSQSSGVRLLSVLFGIFNQVVLTVAIIIIVYTAMMGTLNTAHEGKAMGDKWNSMWLPVRISMGIALLVPKGGTGYCLAQSLVMWLTLQGVGAGDQVWNAMLDYFAQGGAIYSNETSRATEYMTKENIDYVYMLEGAPQWSKPPEPVTASFLNSMVCNELFNTSSQAQGDTYEVYTIGDKDKYDLLFFGSRKCGNDPTCYGNKSSSGVGGYECGLVQSVASDEGCDPTNDNCLLIRQQIYTTANQNLANSLEPLAKELVSQPDLSDPDSKSEDYYATLNSGAELYINYIVGYEDLLVSQSKKDLRNHASPFDVYKQYGWILAGNYYSVLSAFKEHVEKMNRSFNPASSVGYVGDGPSNSDQTTKAGKAYAAIHVFFDNFKGTEGLDVPGHIYDVPGFEDAITKTDLIQKSGEKRGKKGGLHTIGIVDMDAIFKALGSPTNTAKKRKASKGSATVATRSAVINYINYLTGEGSNSQDMRVAKDPILRAANYGKGLTVAAVILIPVIAGLMTYAATYYICGGITPTGELAQTAAYIVLTPLIALFVFMYVQGAMLGVFIPLIPYLTFFIGAIGWMLQVVEAVAAAPLVAVGLVFPETKDDIWGKAEPAKMLILSLFLRPSLMLVGLSAAMMVMWVLTELLNIGFLILTTVTFRIEDMFGFVTIMMAYTAIFTIVVTRAYSLINVVPNKVLTWIGGHGFEVEGAGEAISAAKSATQEGAGAVSGGLKNQGDTAAASKSAASHRAEKDKISAGTGKIK